MIFEKEKMVRLSRTLLNVCPNTPMPVRDPDLRTLLIFIYEHKILSWKYYNDDCDESIRWVSGDKLG